MSKLNFNFVVKYFFRGLLLVVPIALTIYIIVLAIRWLDGLIPIDIPGLGLLIMVGTVTVFGYLGSTILAKPFIEFFDSVMARLPLVRIIYTSLRDLISAFVGDHKKFNRPVLVNLSSDQSVKRIGFVTQDDLPELIPENMVAVYLPHSYNVSGNVYLVPSDRVTPLDISSTEIMKFVVSGGVAGITGVPSK
ncbi:MAG: DUF502 domain-containing protein [Cyclobacteriaceae bacterium]